MPATQTPIAAFMRYRAIREKQYGQFGFVGPVDRKPRFVIPETSWRPDPALAKALKAISPKFEIIFDPLTRPDWERPEKGCHLYTVERKLGFDWLVLENSLQHDMEAPWPNGEPREPGNWLVEWVKQHDKARMQGDREHIDHDVCRQRVEFNERQQSLIEKADDELADHLFRDVYDPMWNKCRVSAFFPSIITPGR